MTRKLQDFLGAWAAAEAVPAAPAALAERLIFFRLAMAHKCPGDRQLFVFLFRKFGCMLQPATTGGCMASILLIDDDVEVRTSVQRVLELAGHTVHAVADGSYGIHSFRQRRPDLVITDIIMPDQEGIETIRALQRIDPAVPIIAISGGGPLPSQLDYLKMARQFGAVASLWKPFRAAALRELVNDVLVKRAQPGEPAKGEEPQHPGSRCVDKSA
jgi:CheY-like chemotaxis protein